MKNSFKAQEFQFQRTMKRSSRRTISQIESLLNLTIRQSLVCGLLASATYVTPMFAQLKTSAYTPATKFGAVTVYLAQRGPITPQASVASGPFFMTIVNRSGKNVLHVSLTKDSPLASTSKAALASELLETGHKDGAQDQTVLIELASGTYYLTVQEQPSWTVRVVVN